MIALFGLLPDESVEWIVSNSTERRLPQKTVLMTEGARIDSLYIVLEGVMGVYLTASGGQRLGVLGPGAVLGEISFVDDAPTSAAVIADESCLVLELSRVKLTDKIKADTRFAADLYRAIALTVSQKLRKANEKLAVTQNAGDVDKTNGDAAARTAAFKEILLKSDQESLELGTVSDETYENLAKRFHELVEFAHVTLGGHSQLSRFAKAREGARLQHEILPYILMADCAGRAYTKPRGYVGDFYTIEKIYDNEPTGRGRIGPIVDRLFLESLVAVAVRRRRNILAEVIEKAVNDKQGKTNIMSVICGPARELQDAFAKIKNRTDLHATLFDVDAQALAFVESWRNATKLGDQITLMHENLINLALGRKSIAQAPQNLVYSASLLDYFDDKLIVRLLNFIHSILAPGGRVVLSNFHPANVCKEFMDYVFDWNLIHRSEDDMNQLFQKSAFASTCTNFRYDGDKISLFAECVK